MPTHRTPPCSSTLGCGSYRYLPKPRSSETFHRCRSSCRELTNWPMRWPRPCATVGGCSCRTTVTGRGPHSAACRRYGRDHRSVGRDHPWLLCRRHRAHDATRRRRRHAPKDGVRVAGGCGTSARVTAILEALQALGLMARQPGVQRLPRHPHLLGDLRHLQSKLQPHAVVCGNRSDKARRSVSRDLQVVLPSGTSANVSQRPGHRGPG